MRHMMQSRLLLILGLLVPLLFGQAIGVGLAQTDDETDVPILADEVDTEDCIPDEGERPMLLDGARPSSLVVEDVLLYSQPDYTADANPLEIIEIPAGAYVVVFDIDEQTRQWFRIVFPCDDISMTGWVPVETIRYPTRRTNAKPAPPSCAQPVEVVDLLDGEWRSDYNGHVAVVADLFRVDNEERFPRSFYYLTRNRREIRDKERVFETSGTFLIRAAVLGTEVRRGNTIGFSVITSSREELEFFGILYYVPDGCEFGRN